MNSVIAPSITAITNPILVPLEGSELSAAALPLAIDLASRLGAQVTAMVVLKGTDSDDEAAEDDARARIELIIQNRSPLPPPQVDVLRGDPAEEIVWLSQSRHCSMIVMSTHARSGLMRGLLGSVTDRVIRSSRVPVLVVPPAESVEHAAGLSAPGIKTIIVGLDGSELAERSIQYLVPLATALGAGLHLVQVLKPRVAESALLDRPTDPEYVEASRYLELVKRQLVDRGVDTHWTVAEGYVDEALVKLSDEIPGSIVALSTRGLSGLRRWTVGSVTDKVTRSSRQPVLVIPPRLEADESAWSPARIRPV